MPSRRLLQAWLLLGVCLIALMVVVGGVTRLTGSGLSITEWRPVTGAVPPMNEAEWEGQFALYRASPQFQKTNAHFELADFKRIFFWEYLHRLLGRIIGAVFIVPLPLLWRRRWIDGWVKRRVLVLIALGGLQGGLGWFMVKSGLVSVPEVSHYRLAAHLMLALTTFSLALWTWLEVRGGRRDAAPAAARWTPFARAGAALLAAVGLQLVYGAFVAGLKAGYLFSTFPTMNGAWMPEVVFSTAPGWRDALENPATVQFLHRWWGLAVAAAGLGWVVVGLRRQGPRRALAWVGGALAMQYALGALTVVNFVHQPVWWGSVHQAGAVVLLAALVAALFEVRHGGVAEVPTTERSLEVSHTF